VTYHFLPHTADIKVAIDGGTLDELLRDALAISRQLYVGTSPVESRERRPITLACDDVEELVHGFLRELLYQYATDNFIPAALEITQATPTTIRAVIAGERLDALRHATEPEVKAVTRHGFLVRCTEDGWHAEVVFDV
jgi:SHS2 domain-containing protein